MDRLAALPVWVRWMLAIVSALLAAGMLVFTPTGETLSCQADAAGWRCEHRVERRFEDARRQTFDGSSTAEISFVEYTTGKGGRKKMGRIEVFDARGAPLQVFAASRTIARAHYEALRSFVAAAEAGKAPPSLEREHTPLGGGLLGVLVFVVAAGFFVYSVFQGGSGTSAGTLAAPASPQPASPVAKSQRRVGLFVIGGVLTVGAILTAVEFLGQSGKGYVEVRCEHRCRVDGLDCRPPGVVGSWQPPGTYTVEAYDPEAPNGWTPVSVEVVAGERHTLVCRPPS